MIPSHPASRLGWVGGPIYLSGRPEDIVALIIVGKAIVSLHTRARPIILRQTNSKQPDGHGIECLIDAAQELKLRLTRCTYTSQCLATRLRSVYLATLLQHDEDLDREVSTIVREVSTRL